MDMGRGRGGLEERDKRERSGSRGKGGNEGKRKRARGDKIGEKSEKRGRVVGEKEEEGMENRFFERTRVKKQRQRILKDSEEMGGSDYDGDVD